MNPDLAWYGGKAPWELTQDAFLALHNTGFIPSSAYTGYEETGGLAWLGAIAKYPVLLSQDNNVEYRQTGERLRYVQRTEDGNTVRDPAGLACYLSDSDIERKGYPKFDQTIVAFVDGEPIGFSSNEFGAVGVWVEARHQKNGIGVSLLKQFLDRAPRMRIGQMTDAGIACVRKLHTMYTSLHSPAQQDLPRRLRP